MTLNDLLKSALKGIEGAQGDNPDPKLDALGSHIAVVLAELEAAAASKASAPPKAKKPVVVGDQRSAATPGVAPSKATEAKEPVVVEDQGSAAAPVVAPSKPTAAKWRVVKDPRLKG